jgi:hypothetical protein
MNIYVRAHLPPSEKICTSCLSRLTLASLLQLSILLLLNFLLKLQAKMPTMQKHGMKLSLLKILELPVLFGCKSFDH